MPAKVDVQKAFYFTKVVYMWQILHASKLNERVNIYTIYILKQNNHPIHYFIYEHNTLFLMAEI